MQPEFRVERSGGLGEGNRKKPGGVALALIWTMDQRWDWREQWYWSAGAETENPFISWQCDPPTFCDVARLYLSRSAGYYGRNIVWGRRMLNEHGLWKNHKPASRTCWERRMQKDTMCLQYEDAHYFDCSRSKSILIPFHELMWTEPFESKGSDGEFALLFFDLYN